jgi:peptidoglycan/xylan/chitin deacetylase (PgdA/CDA1 family)
VRPQHLAEHLEALRKHCRPLHLVELAEALGKGKLPRRAVVVTFDDGYCDNLFHAKPLLERYDVPATVFVATGYTGGGREFWWDELDRLILQPGTLPETLSLSVNGDRLHWELGEAAHYSELDYQRDRHWKPRDELDPGRRQSLYRELWNLLRPLPEIERQKVRDELVAWSGVMPAGRASHRPLSREEILALSRDGLVHIGCHTITHAQLSALPADSQREEIRQSKAYLEDLIGHPVSTFAYPYGQPSDYTDETIAIAREAGFDCACSTVAGVVDRRADAFQLPRLQGRDVDGESFARILSEWFDD